MKVSELTLEDITIHCGISECDESEKRLLNACKQAAIAYVKGHTGLSAEDIDSYEDITIAVECLINEMYNQREMTVTKSTLNPTITAILGMHSRNFVT